MTKRKHVSEVGGSDRRLAMLRIGWGLAIAAITLSPVQGADAPVSLTWRTTPVEFAANVLLFVPMFATVDSATRPWRFPLVAALLGTMLIECCQWVIPGRQSSPIDIVANVAGAACGLALGRYWAAACRHDRAARSRRVLIAVALIAPISLAVDGATARFVGSVPPYYVIERPAYAWLATPTWEIADVRLNGAAVGGPRLEPRAWSAASGPCAGGALTARLVVRTRQTAGWAPLVRVSDEHGATLSVLADYHGALVLSSRSVLGTLGAGEAWHVLMARTNDADTLHLRIHCAQGLLTWHVDGETPVQGSSDLRFGHLLRSLFSGPLLAVNPRLVLLPLMLVWAALGLMGGRALMFLLAAPHGPAWAGFWSVVTLIPGAVAWGFARGDARVAAFAWTASIVVSSVVVRRRHLRSRSMPRVS
jgi:VanZ like family